MKLGNPDLTVGQQVSMMKARFSQLIYRRGRQGPTWKGRLQPTDDSPQYAVRIIYPYPHPPKVWVLDPPIDPQAHHRYSDDSLCLYYPKDGSWHRRKFIADTVVPWTVEWLALYEIWLITGEWYGEEVAHTGEK